MGAERSAYIELVAVDQVGRGEGGSQDVLFPNPPQPPPPPPPKIFTAVVFHCSQYEPDHTTHFSVIVFITFENNN